MSVLLPLDERPTETAPARPELDLLRGIPACASLPEPVLTRLAAVSTVLQAELPTELCRQGDPATSLMILLEGQVVMSGAATNGNRAVVEVVRPVSFILLATVLARLSYPMSAETLSPSRVLSIRADGLHALMSDSPELAQALVRAQAMEYGAMVRQVCDLKLRTAAERLASYLLALAQEHGSGSQFRLPVRKRLLAAQLGCGQENLSRAFATLREFGVETHGIRVILHDIPRLRGFAFPGGSAGMAE
jgi:CRP/FNR family transcriptional activator FtrB